MDSTESTTADDSGFQKQEQQDPPPSLSSSSSPPLPTIVNICDTGDIILDVTFEPSRFARRPALTTSKPRPTTTTTNNNNKTIITSRPATSTPRKPATPRKPTIPHKVPPTPTKTPVPARTAAPRTTPCPPLPSQHPPPTRVAYRVSLDALCLKSSYFRNLLSNPAFSESNLVTARLAALSLPVAAADPSSLPWIPILDDDHDTTQCPDRAPLFGDLLRILHSQLLPTTTTATADLSYAATLVILANRYDCVDAVRPAAAALRFKWPPTTPPRGERATGIAAEETLRKMILVAYRAGHGPRLLAATKELILRGSRRWSPFPWDNHPDDADARWAAAWWTLPDGLEHELQHRRGCVLDAIASVPRHFIRAYSSRTTQCQRSYDTSPACDAFQLGQMLKFLARKDLVYVYDFGPSSLDGLPDPSRLHVADLLALLKECPGYQIDKHHTNCGLRTRLEPIVRFLEAMVASQALGIRPEEWTRSGTRDSWVPDENEELDRFDSGVRNFEFTRAMISDPWFHYAGALGADALARRLFTSNTWDWTPEMGQDTHSPKVI